jgi:cell wall-associated NlpC family hydrolase
MRSNRPASKDVATRNSAVVPARRAAPKPGRKRRAGILNLVVVTIAAGIIATMAIPAYAFAPGSQKSEFGSSAIDKIKTDQSQSVTVSNAAAGPAVSRDTLSATSQQQLDDQKTAAAAAAAQAAAAAAAAQQATTQLTTYAASYSGPSAADYLANPPYPNFSLSQVFNVAYQYYLDKVPYVFGGATPAGFDCSGYVMFVYAQFGVSLPHSVSGIAARGTRISEADAVPGDVIIMDGHTGFYAGNHEIMDAPDVGRDISLRPIWTDDYYIVRIGI